MGKMGEMGVIGITLGMEVIEVSCSTITKAALTYGMTNLVFLVYYRVLALLLLLPTCFFLYRKVSLPSITRSTLLLLVLLGFLTYSATMLSMTGLNYSSPTLYSAIANLSPAFTFIFALLFRMETLNLKEKSSFFKFVGTIILLTGAFTIIFYKGIPITFSPSTPSSGQQLQTLLRMGANWAIGGFFLLSGSLIMSTSFIVKTWVSREYPFQVMTTLICCFFETIFALLGAAIGVKDSSAWRLKLDITLIAILYAAILMAGVVSPVQFWVLRKKGPVFLVMFRPLQMIIAMLLGVATLGDTLHLGSVLGGATIALGFYTVMKGKAMEEETSLADGSCVSCSGDSSPDQAPLLQDKNVSVVGRW